MTKPSQQKAPKVFYAGDSTPDGPACYLLSILRHLKMDVRHVAPSQRLTPELMRTRYDAIILSDYSRKGLAEDAERRMAEMVLSGAGLAMIGGWGSFSGPFGGWKGSQIETLLPVNCLNRDDRMNFSGGAHIRIKRDHTLLRGIPKNRTPAIVGMNHVVPKKNAVILATVRNIVSGNKQPHYVQTEYPLLVIDRDPAKRIAVLTTDLAPHWCGGLLDWGTKPLKLPSGDKRWVEVWDTYVRFVSNLLCWLTCKA
jgi:uncharacterized membrane protein